MKKAMLLVTILGLLLSIVGYAAQNQPGFYKSEKAPDNPVINAILDSRSDKTFADRPVPDQLIELILQCGIKAPSAMNQQPWYFSVITNRGLLDRIDSEAPAGGPPPKGAPIQKPPQPMEKRHMFSHAPVAIIISATVESQFSTFDSALACENMALAAQSLGLATRIIASSTIVLNGPKEAEYRKILRIPEGKKPVAALLLGYPAGGPDAATGASTRNANVFTFIR